jgi:hypothetical protein
MAESPLADIEKVAAAIREIAAPPKKPDANSKAEATDYEEAHKDLDLQDKSQYIKARKTYAARVYWLVLGWLIATLLIVLFSGYPGERISLFGLNMLGPKISDPVLIALISGTSVNVIGLLAIVIAYLFPKREKP